MAQPKDKAQIQAALVEVWGRTRPVILERTTAVERAAAELSNEHPNLQALEAGRAEAHKLAGVLGTFGLDRGTELARELEGLLGSGHAAADGPEPVEIAAELRAVVESAYIGDPDS